MKNLKKGMKFKINQLNGYTDIDLICIINQVNQYTIEFSPKESDKYHIPNKCSMSRTEFNQALKVKQIQLNG